MLNAAFDAKASGLGLSFVAGATVPPICSDVELAALDACDGVDWATCFAGAAIAGSVRG